MKVITFHTQHDGGLAVSESGRLPLALQLERLFEQRYLASSHDVDALRAQWSQAVARAVEVTGIEHFDVGVTSWVMPSKRRVLQDLVRAHEWRTVDDHVAHALHALHNAPFARPIIFSYDGGGNDGTFRVFRGVKATGRLDPVAGLPLNLGTPSRLLATAMPEVTGGKPQPRTGHLSLAGKLMAYAALGEAEPAWRRPVEEYYRTYQEPNQALYSLGEGLGLDLEPDQLTPDDARALAVTSQEVLTDIVLEIVGHHLGPADDGNLLTGGCALNVVTNERLRHVASRPVHVPPAPNDAGIAVGALWSVAPARGVLNPFVGPPLERDVGEAAFEARGSRECGVDEVARLVAAGAVVGIAVGRAELGPRALGNRSIVAVPGTAAIRERINARIKGREWYRPVAPAVLERDTATFFDDPPRSPYMSFAPRVRPDARALIPAALHVDGTARVQTVSDTETVLGRLLGTLHARGAIPCVFNTSFNVRGQPLLQRVSAALSALDTTDLDFAWIDGWLVPKSPAHAEQFAEAAG